MYTLAEMTDMVASWEEQSAAQAPYFDGRLLAKIQSMHRAIAEYQEVQLELPIGLKDLI